MEKRLIATLVAAAFASTAGMAVAATGPINVTGSIQYASEAVGGTFTGSMPIGNVAYSLAAPLAANTTQVVRFELSGKVAACPGLQVQGTFVGSPISPTTPSPSGSATTRCDYSVVVGANAVPVDSVLSFTGGTADAAAGPALADGGKLTAVVSILNSANAIVEGPSDAATVATAAHALTAAWTPSSVSGTAANSPFTTGTTGTGIEQSRIDVSADPISSKFTGAPADVTGGSTTVINLGAFQLLQNSGTFKNVNGATDVTIAALTTNSWKMEVTGPFVANTTAAMVYGTKSADCTGAKTPFTIASGKATATYSAVDAAAGAFQTLYVCYEPNVGSKTLSINPGQFAGSATTTAGTAAAAAAPPVPALPAVTLLGESASGNLYNLLSNGAQIDLRVMTTSGTTGWSTVVRLINTGSSTVDVSATYLNTDGTTGAKGTIVSGLKPGATAMLSSAQIEAALGVSLASTGNPPRLRISAPTDSLRAQAWIQSPNGAWFMGTPSQGAEVNGVSDAK